MSENKINLTVDVVKLSQAQQEYIDAQLRLIQALESRNAKLVTALQMLLASVSGEKYLGQDKEIELCQAALKENG